MASLALPESMRAWTFNARGSPEQVLSLSSSLPVPSAPTGSNVLIKISHAGITSAGVNLLQDIPSFLRKNAIPEVDFSGIAVLAGPSVPSTFAPGTRVFGAIPPSSSVLSGVGTLAEYVVVPFAYTQVIPSNMSFEDAATLGGLAQTALRMVEKADVKKNDRILLHGASGGVGMVAIQLAKARGATIVATCSSAKFQMVQSAGANELIDYGANKPLYQYLQTRYTSQNFDSILDTVGSQDLYVHCVAYLKPKGVYVSVGELEDSGKSATLWRWLKNSTLPSALGGVPRHFVMFGGAITSEGVKKLAEEAEQGHLKAFIDSTFKMEDALAAYERLKSRDAKGRILVQVAQLAV